MQSTQTDLFGQMGAILAPVPKAEFYNTIHLQGPELAAAKAQTADQDSRVLEIFRKGGKLTPVDAWEAYCRDFPAPPLTSIRRSITVLTGQGKLQKLAEMKMGKFGKPNYLWQAL